ncbi:TPA: hypothetical protein PFD71_003232 [Vibrio cholerae]|nr:hypothetical protein [Vibrio cholerae]
MINSKLVGKTLPEIIHMIVFEEITEVNYHDGEYMESLLQEYISQEELEDAAESNSEDSYYEGLCDGSRETHLKLNQRIADLEQLLKENGIEFD